MTSLAREAWDRRDQFGEEFPDVEEAVDRCLSTDSGPVVLSDRGDVTLAGAPGDSPVVLRELLNREDATDSGALIPIVDPEATRSLADSRGKTVSIDVGGKLTPEFSPVSVTGEVEEVFEGPFELEGSYYSGKTFDLGTRVVFNVAERDVSLLLSEQAGTTTDPSFFTVHGLDPEASTLVVVKSANHFRPNFEPVASAIVPVDSPGTTSINLSRFDYEQGRPFYPLDDPVPDFSVFRS